MRLNAKEQPEIAMNVKAILLDGKPVPLSMVHEFDDEKGYVTSYVPKLPDKLGTISSDGSASNPSSMSEFELVTRHGKVQVTFNDVPGDD